MDCGKVRTFGMSSDSRSFDASGKKLSKVDGDKGVNASPRMLSSCIAPPS
jgi:hypothetical protein